MATEGAASRARPGAAVGMRRRLDSLGRDIERDTELVKWDRDLMKWDRDLMKWDRDLMEWDTTLRSRHARSSAG